MREHLRAGVEAGGLLAVLGALVWATGRPLLFPSLGPTAYALVTRPDAPTNRPRRVVGGHAVGVVAGLVAVHALAPGLVVTATPGAGSAAALRLAASGAASVGLTAAGMLATDLRHAPACATTLIVSLGLLPDPGQGLLMLAAVALLVGAHRAMGALAARGRGDAG